MGLLDFITSPNSGQPRTGAPIPASEPQRRPGIFDSLVGEPEGGGLLGLNRNEILLNMGAGLLSQPTLAAGVGAGLQGVQRSRERNRQHDYQKKLFEYRQQRDASADDFRNRAFDYRAGRDEAGDEFRNRQFDASQNYRNQALDIQRQSLALRGRNADPNQAYATRAAAAQQFGMQPDTPELRSYVLTGKLPMPAEGNGFGKAPAGYRYQPDGTLAAIPGGPATKLPAEVAGRMAAMDTAMAQLPEVKSYFLNPNLTAGDRLGEGVGQLFNAGDYGRAQRSVKLAIESALRAMTGAAAPESEVANYMGMFMPSPYDAQETRAQKLGLLEAFMTNAKRNIQQGRGGQSQGAVGGGEGQWQTLPGGIRIRERGGTSANPIQPIPAPSGGFSTHAKALPAPGGFSTFYKGAQ